MTLLSHPQVVTLHARSKPRVMFAGDQLVMADLPAGTRVIYPKPPLEALPNVDAAIRHAINHPVGTAPLYARLKPGMKVVIAIDDISLPLPVMRAPDVRERVLTILLELLANHGVDDVRMIIATAFHRRMKPSEIKHMVGEKIFNAYHPMRLCNHDAEDPRGMKEIGTTSEGEVVEINKRAAESDLLIYVNLNFVPMNGGHKSVAVGLAGYRSLKAHHNPYKLREGGSYMDPERSSLQTSFARMGKLVNDALDVFTIETTVNNRMFDRPLEFLGKNEDELSTLEQFSMKALVRTLEKMPQGARHALFDKFPAPYGVTSVFAGETEAVHALTLEKSFEQLLVPVRGQADVMITGIPFISPYNVHAFLNPLLVQVLAQGYLFNLHKGAPLVKKGGTLIITHPCTDKFDQEQHAAYAEFVHRVLPETRDAVTMHKKFEAEFAQNPAYIQAYRTGYAYHPVHPFYMWYWGEPGRQHLGRVIVVGADNEYIPKLLGYETARTMGEALEMARGVHGPDMSITMMHTAPMLMADVTV